MTPSESSRPGFTDTLGILKLLAGITLLVALSWEILAGDHTHLSDTYLTIQFFVCMVFSAISCFGWSSPRGNSVFSYNICSNC